VFLDLLRWIDKSIQYFIGSVARKVIVA